MFPFGIISKHKAIPDSNTVESSDSCGRPGQPFHFWATKVQSEEAGSGPGTTMIADRKVLPESPDFRSSFNKITSNNWKCSISMSGDG